MLPFLERPKVIAPESTLWTPASAHITCNLMFYWVQLACQLLRALSHNNPETEINRTKGCRLWPRRACPRVGKVCKGEGASAAVDRFTHHVSWANHVTSAPLSCLTHPPHIHTLSGTSSQQELFSTQCHRLKREDKEEHKNTESPCFFNTDLIKKTFTKTPIPNSSENSLITFCFTQVLSLQNGLVLTWPSHLGVPDYLQWGTGAQRHQNHQSFGERGSKPKGVRPDTTNKVYSLLVIGEILPGAPDFIHVTWGWWREKCRK